MNDTSHSAIGKIDSCDSSTPSSQSADLPFGWTVPAWRGHEAICPLCTSHVTSVASGRNRTFVPSQHIPLSLPLLPSQRPSKASKPARPFLSTVSPFPVGHANFFKLPHIDTAPPPARPSNWDGLRRWCLTKLRWPCKSLLSPRGLE